MGRAGCDGSRLLRLHAWRSRTCLRIPNDFSAAKKAAIEGVPYLQSVKVAFEAPRFWETDDNIFGGLAWTDRANENVIYPSHGIGSPKGVFVGAYVAGWTNQDNPQKFAAYSNEERLRVSRASVEALHPGRSKLLSKGVSVGWGLIPYSEGVGALWPDDRRSFARRAARVMLSCSNPRGRSSSPASI